MFMRTLGLGMMLFGLVAVAEAGPKDDANSQSGSVVKAAMGKLVITGADKKEHSYSIGEKTTITVAGKTAKLEDLKKGSNVVVSLDKDGGVTSVTAAAEKASVPAQNEHPAPALQKQKK